MSSWVRQTPTVQGNAKKPDEPIFQAPMEVGAEPRSLEVKQYPMPEMLKKNRRPAPVALPVIEPVVEAPVSLEVRHGIALVERLAIFRFCCCWLLIFFGHKIYSATKALRTPSGNNLPLHWLCELCVSVAIILVNKNAPDLRSEASAFISSGDER